MFISYFQLYLGCRWFPLFVLAVQFVNFDASHENNCQVWKLLILRYSNGEILSYSQATIVMTFVRYSSTSVVSSLFQPTLQASAYLSFLFSSALIILRM